MILWRFVGNDFVLVAINVIFANLNIPLWVLYVLYFDSIPAEYMRYR
jgi:hypothetical protein